jgi:hypothetical protein
LTFGAHSVRISLPRIGAEMLKGISGDRSICAHDRQLHCISAFGELGSDFSVLALIVGGTLTLIGLVIDFTFKPRNQLVAEAATPASRACYHRLFPTAA